MAEHDNHGQSVAAWTTVGTLLVASLAFAFAVVLEKAPAGTNSGAAPAMSNFFYWLRDVKPEYVK